MLSFSSISMLERISRNVLELYVKRIMRNCSMQCACVRLPLKTFIISRKKKNRVMEFPFFIDDILLG